jgi:hypothetical protein
MTLAQDVVLGVAALNTPVKEYKKKRIGRNAKI